MSSSFLLPCPVSMCLPVFACVCQYRNIFVESWDHSSEGTSFFWESLLKEYGTPLVRVSWLAWEPRASAYHLLTPSTGITNPCHQTRGFILYYWGIKLSSSCLHASTLPTELSKPNIAFFEWLNHSFKYEIQDRASPLHFSRTLSLLFSFTKYKPQLTSNY